VQFPCAVLKKLIIYFNLWDEIQGMTSLGLVA